MQFLENGFIKITVSVSDNLTDDDKQKLLKLMEIELLWFRKIPMICLLSKII